MIGFYDYTVVLTYISLLISLVGMRYASSGHIRLALICLALCGFCDMFDGKIARTKKNRTTDEKMFGIQIDSMCDLICFGIFPIVIFYNCGVSTMHGMFLLGFYALGSVIRLSYYNVLEISRQQTEGGSNKYFHGLPITSISIILPIFFLLRFVLTEDIFTIALYFVPLIVGLLFIIDFKLKKPSNIVLAFLVVMVACTVLSLFFIKARL